MVKVESRKSIRVSHNVAFVQQLRMIRRNGHSLIPVGRVVTINTKRTVLSEKPECYKTNKIEDI